MNRIKKTRQANFDGNIRYQDLSGQAQLINDDPIDMDAITMDNESYLNASGVFRGRLRKGIKNVGKNIRNRHADKTKLKMTQAKTAQIAAKNLGKTDPLLVAALSQPASVVATPIEPTGMSLAVKIGIGAGIALLIGIGIFVYVKHKKK